MTRVLVNNRPQQTDSGLKTLGDLLAWADHASAARGELVTAVRLDGVDEPSFREESHVARALRTFAVVELDVATPAALVAESLDEALSGLTGLRQHTLEVAGRFRTVDIALANTGLAELTQGLRTLVTLVDAVGGAMGVQLDALALGGRPVNALLDDLARQLVTLGEAQRLQDWVAVADVLEFDLEPALSQCEPLFTALSDLARQAQPVQ